jgi:hypothetical protein
VNSTGTQQQTAEADSPVALHWLPCCHLLMLLCLPATACFTLCGADWEGPPAATCEAAPAAADFLLPVLAQPSKPQGAVCLVPRHVVSWFT